MNHKVEISTYAEETLTQNKTDILAIYEANGINIYPESKAHLISKKTGEVRQIDFPDIEYRITDATDIDENGDFWVINYFYPGDKRKLKLGNDSFITKFGIGRTHKNNKQVERLIKLNFDGEKISLTDTPPVQLELKEGTDSNNWEGIVKLDDKGFLLIADYYPYTRMVFVPYNFDK